YYSNKAQTHTAAHGDVTIQAHQNEMRLDSEQVLRIHSRDSIEIIAPDTMTLKAAGSGIEMSGGNVTFITPSQVGYKASKVDWGSGGGGRKNIKLKQSNIKAEDMEIQYVDAYGNSPKNEVIRILFNDEEIVIKALDDDGKAVIEAAPYGQITAQQKRHK
uniref:DUF2345 domain-containing protein n=1 Tax=Psychrobacter alimentarius TaxID=261164 RepID=UPI001918F7A7